MDAIDRLSHLFEKFPGIGPRQAQRFVHYLLRVSPSLRNDLVDAIRQVSSTVHQCPECKRFSVGAHGPCSLCTSKTRDETLLAVVATDADLNALERSGTFNGKYFVLGGTISLASDKTSGLRVHELVSSVPGRIKEGLQEIILSFPANPEGDATAIRLHDELMTTGVKITKLGRGLSTGSELEYADPDTLKNALDSRR